MSHLAAKEALRSESVECRSKAFQIAKSNVDYTGMHPDMMHYYRLLRKRFAKVLMPIYAAEVNPPHSFRLEHFVLKDKVSPEQWDIIAFEVKDVERSQQGNQRIKVTWGGDLALPLPNWVFFDHHFIDEKKLDEAEIRRLREETIRGLEAFGDIRFPNNWLDRYCVSDEEARRGDKYLKEDCDAAVLKAKEINKRNG